MPTIYQIADNSYWTGKSRQIGDRDPAPRGWTRAPVPDLSEGEYAVWTGAGFRVTTDPPPVPQGPTIEERRAKMEKRRGPFALAAHAAGIITEDEALDWAGGTRLPAAIEMAFSALPAGEQLAAKIEARTVTRIRRNAPLIEMLRADLGLTPEQADALFKDG